MDRALAGRIMRSRLLLSALTALPLFAACAAEDEGPTPFDDEAALSEDTFADGAPANDTLPDDNKADANYPAKFELEFQSPVKSQGSRGVCSIFASTALVENLYIKAGMPVADADFSEQWLQWATKSLAGEFTWTDGSSADVNLATVAEFGTIKEADWPYESSPWTAANDPECGATENKPTKCYTNGEAPETAKMAEKFKLPNKRWINTNSIKAHITAKGTGVNVGMTFFYQSWNHRKSTLPVNSEYWRKGYVTYPNADDKTESMKQRAGHAIHIIGWDDNLEVEMRDKEGKPILDANGNPQKEKGFYLFKNSWGTAGFGVDHPTGPGYGWLSYKYVNQYGSAVVVTELPTVGGGGGGGGGTGGTPRTYSATPNAAIPDDDTTGVTSTITVPDRGTVTTVKVTVDITHTYRGDLKLTLSKGTTSKVIFNGDGGSADDLKQTFTVEGLAGQALDGDWTLKVEDTYGQDLGNFNKWTLEVAAN